jgi:hypothetical protein
VMPRRMATARVLMSSWASMLSARVAIRFDPETGRLDVVHWTYNEFTVEMVGAQRVSGAGRGDSGLSADPWNSVTR